MGLKFPFFTKAADAAPDAPAFQADAPIRRASEDLLGRREFAQALGKVLATWRGDFSLVVGLRGGWGEGKSSLKNLALQAAAEQAKRPSVVEFNPWRHGDSAAITNAFYQELAAALGDADKSLAGRQRAWAFQRYARFFTTASGGLKSTGEPIGNAVGWLAGIGFLSAGVGALNSLLPLGKLAPYLLMTAGGCAILGKVLSALGGAGRPTKPLELVRADLEQKLKKLDRPLIVVIDDIDRLEADQIRTVFRHVKANADLPRLTYLLLFQPTVVEAALNPVAAGDGRGYLEKIIQASFDLPAVEISRVHKALFAALDLALAGNLTPRDGFDALRWGNLFHGGLKLFIQNLRDVHRYMAAVSVHITLHRGAKILEVNIIDFLVLEGLRVFEPDAFAAIAANKPLLTAVGGRNEAEGAPLRAIIEAVAVERREPVEELLRGLFPNASWAFGGAVYGPDFVEDWQNDRRVCTAAFFDRYFVLRVPDEKISESDLVDFLEKCHDRQAIELAFTAFDERHLLKAMIARLDDARQRLPLENTATLLPALMDVTRYFQAGGEMVGFDSPWIYAWRTALWLLQRDPDQAARGAHFLAALAEAQDLAVARTLISIDDERRTKPDGKPVLFSNDDLAKAKTLWVERLETFLGDPDRALAHPQIVSYLYTWRRLAGNTAPGAWVRARAEDPLYFLPVLRAFRSMSTSQVVGDHVGRVLNRLSTRDLNHFYPFEEAQARARVLDRSGLDEEDKALVETLLTDAQPTGDAERD